MGGLLQTDSYIRCNRAPSLQPVPTAMGLRAKLAGKFQILSFVATSRLFESY